jgi:hypothetical protein
LEVRLENFKFEVSLGKGSSATLFSKTKLKTELLYGSSVSALS